MNDADRTPIEDTRFGEITVRQDCQDRLEVEGEGIPRVTLERDPESEVDPQTAIGTRDPAHLTMRIDGREVELKPAKGGLRRRSYRVDVEYEGVGYRLVPDSVPSSRLTRDGVHIGDFSSDGDEMVIAEWKEGAEIRPVDASIGYALSSAFGTGGQPMWMMIADGVSSALP
ncbi:hypothetical protein [Streptomyces lunaelactis]|uniref:hypothetical protein n=1 Tax=Streptomyces lunaelactis TaxID=1535768 RepID=UPI001585A7D5|nr:hypothetical protein [Streptomyces lunaelactis]NUK00555.1 hypothetical protein [Streptomyces lunaelactis]NUK14716.1 hypothetical protein [Streptomyces lunaelactis]NUK24163.1 hypothetical protein [Streptomyces lunaelactis]